MEIKQNQNTGDGSIEFTENERKIISETGKLTFSRNDMGAFANVLMHTAVSLFAKVEDIKEKK